MAKAQFLKTRIAPDIKRRVQRAAEEQLVTESVWLRRAVVVALGPTVERGCAGGDTGSERLTGVASNARLYVRLRSEDCLLLRERATGRGMHAATYVSVLVRSHLRGVAPIPKAEYLALKQSISELGALGRNLNQIARAIKQGERPAPLGRSEVATMLKVAGATGSFQGTAPRQCT